MNSKFDRLYKLIMEGTWIKFGQMEDEVIVKDMVCKIFASRKDGQPLSDEEYGKEEVTDNFIKISGGGFKKPSEIKWDWYITYPVGDDPAPRTILTSSHVDNPNAGNMFLIRNTLVNVPTINMPQFVSMDEAKEFMKKYMEQNYNTFVNIVENRWKKERGDKTSVNNFNYN